VEGLGLLANRRVVLQSPPFGELLAARAEAAPKGLTIWPAGDDSSRRTFAEFWSVAKTQRKHFRRLKELRCEWD
jgi:hypothetical protein